MCTAANIPRLHLDPLTPSAVITPPCSQHAFNAQIKVQPETPRVLLISVPFQPVECSEWIVVYLATQTQAQHICSAFKSKTRTALHSCGTERNQSVNLFGTAVKLEFGLLVYFVLLVQAFVILIRTKKNCEVLLHFFIFLFKPHTSHTSTALTSSLSPLSPLLAAEVKEAAGEPRPGAQVPRQRAARGDFREPQTTHW